MSNILLSIFLLYLSFLNAEQVVILGSGPAGSTAAIYAARSHLSTLIIGGNEPGGQIATSYHVENFPGFKEGINGYELGQNMLEQAIRFGAKLKAQKVINVDVRQRPFRLTLDNDETVFATTLIIATGSSPKLLGLTSEKALFGSGVSSCALCDGPLFKGKKVVVVGGGDSALEEALFITQFASNVTVIHRKSELKASQYLQEKALKHPKIQFIWNHTVEKIEDPNEGKVTGIKIQNVITKDLSHLTCDGVFLAIGHTPNTALFKGQIQLDEKGYIICEPFSTKTSVLGVFAAGDIADPHYRQAITAAATGCMAAIDAYHFIQQNQ